MNMRIHSFIAPELLPGELVTLSPDESHHLARVLRVEPGQELTLFDGQGTRAEGIADTVTKKEITVRILAREMVPSPAVEITLIQAVCKPDRFELILQKATELGVGCIQPTLSAHTIYRSKQPEKQVERWKTIIRNAAQQCGATWLPDVQPLKKMDSLLPTLRTFDAAFIGSLHPNAKPFKEAFRSLTSAGIQPALRVALLIGPEGDFTEDEVHAAVVAGANPVTFGKQILRTETAALFGLSVLVYELF